MLNLHIFIHGQIYFCWCFNHPHLPRIRIWGHHLQMPRWAPEQRPSPFGGDCSPPWKAWWMDRVSWGLLWDYYSMIIWDEYMGWLWDYYGMIIWDEYMGWLGIIMGWLYGMNIWDDFMGLFLGWLWDYYGMIMGWLYGMNIWDDFMGLLIMGWLWDYYGTINYGMIIWDDYGIIMGWLWDDYMGWLWD